MLRILNSTLVADGRSDRVLVPLINKLMAVHCPCAYRDTDFVEDYPASGNSLALRVRFALAQYPCDILFVHRDAEQRDAVQQREAEIKTAVAGLTVARPFIAIVPVRMTEAWLLADEQAIRHAAGNPTGRVPLNLPTESQIEVVDAIERLFEALTLAKNLNNRRTSRLRPEALRHRVADHLDDLAALRRLPSFARFERGLRDLFQTPEFLNA